MRKIFTLNDDILLIPYNPKSFKLFIKSELRKVKLMEMGPSEVSVKKVLSYAKALSVHKTKKLGPVNVILN